MKKAGIPRVLERDVQRAVIQLLKACGADVYHTSQGYRHDPGGTRCTPGIPDLFAFFPRLHRTLWWEVKAHGGRRTDAQVAFGYRCAANNQPYGFGGIEEAKQLMQEWGLAAA